MFGPQLMVFFWSLKMLMSILRRRSSSATHLYHPELVAGNCRCSEGKGGSALGPPSAAGWLRNLAPPKKMVETPKKWDKPSINWWFGFLPLIICMIIDENLASFRLCHFFPAQEDAVETHWARVSGSARHGYFWAGSTDPEHSNSKWWGLAHGHGGTQWFIREHPVKIWVIWGYPHFRKCPDNNSQMAPTDPGIWCLESKGGWLGWAIPQQIQGRRFAFQGVHFRMRTFDIP